VPSALSSFQSRSDYAIAVASYNNGSYIFSDTFTISSGLQLW
jgi:hypothetical protein